MSERAHTRREPRQQRARFTVDAVLQAVQIVAKRYGPQSVTTNRIAQVAGVSVGTLYQYFPDKRAIFTALYDRHVDDVRQVMEQTTTAWATAPLGEFTRELVHGLVQAHADLAELHELVSSAVPQSAQGFRNALHHTFGLALSRTDQEPYNRQERERMLFVLPRMVESLVHGAAHHPPADLSRDGAGSEAIRTVLLYVNSFRGSAPRYF
ncbi:TetR/AcrR family transcriptional regulator [Silvimonas amylolytica]|nr:TetR/AcrR family transcriptional regulator [Silvimonas amylolytica]